MNTLEVWLEKYGGVPEDYLISSGGSTPAVCQYKGALAVLALSSSSESSICSLPGAVVCGIHVLFIAAAAVF